ncbi:MAG TPA: alanine--tRNA ligase [Terriglobia bacterium]|nr:alanine--tRNA ligase [Terriglobia bacterium]
MTSDQIRSQFLKFFEERGHRVVRSSSLVPANDPTLLFSNAGMNQFKDVFLGREKRDYTRACSSQKCVRAGGKHNDLEQVGRTARHHTFFEMLGNFSFGNYFKKDAIGFAWELITSPSGYGIPLEKLYFTVFGGAEIPPATKLPPDEDAASLWIKIGAPNDRVHRIPGLKENFWQMGETGPCGPCSEIHYDMGAAASNLGHADCKFPCDCGRYVELWNLVFMQFNRDEQGNMTPLPRPSIDTGAGLERLAAVLQGKLSNFDTDLFQPLIEEAAELANVEYGANHETNVSLRIIADHSRAATFLISDGVLPSNEGRGYVLRLIMRRALYHGQTLGLNEPFLYKMSGHVVDLMKGAYPELVESAQHIARAIKIEEERYEKTTKVGIEEFRKLLEGIFPGLLIPGWGEPRPTGLDAAAGPDIAAPGPGGVKLVQSKIVPGGVLFRVHDTFGLRPEFARDIARDWGFDDVNQAEYESEMQKQRERARASWKGAEKKVASPIYRELVEKHPTTFDGYTQTESADCKVVALVVNGKSVTEVKTGEKAEIILDHTPFYAEAGGQVGDTGRLYGEAGEEVAQVTDTQRPVIGLIVHKITALQPLEVGMMLTAKVDAERRDTIRRNHTATHLLHAALRTTLGTHVKQAGSLVAPARLRFDFTHYAPLEEQDRLDIEDLVNRHILANEEMHTDVMDIDSAINSGAMALFGEKYSEKVRVVSVADGSFSKELCGGTHVRRTGDIGLFKLISESSVSAGTRRIEAVTGTAVIDDLRKAGDTLARLGETLRAKPDEILPAAERLAHEEKKLRKELEAQQLKRAAASTGGLIDQARDVKGVRVLSTRIEPMDRAAIRQIVDNLRAKLGTGVIVLGSAADGSVSLIAAVSKDLTAKLDAGKIVKAVAAIVEGSGGGRKDMAEAGGKNPAKLDESLAAVPGIIEAML